MILKKKRLPSLMTSSIPVATWSPRVFQLDNGMVVAIDEQFEVEMAAFYLRINAGSISEGQYSGSGLSHLLEHAMFLGCQSIPKQDGFSRVIESLGGVDLNAYTTYDHTAYFATVFASKLPLALKSLKAFVFDPLFPEKALLEEMGTIRSEMQMAEDRVSWVFHDAIQGLAYPKLPYAYPILGVKSLFNKLSRADVIAYHQKHYVPKNMILSLRGAIDTGQTVKRIEKLFQAKASYQNETNIKGFLDLPPRNSKLKKQFTNGAPSTTRPKPKAITTMVHPRSQHIQLAYVWDTPTFGAADDVLVNLFDSFLAGGTSTPLYHKLKEELSLVESLYAHAFVPVPYFKKAHGTFSLYLKLKVPKNPREFKTQVLRLTHEIFSVLINLRSEAVLATSKQLKTLTNLLTGIQNEAVKEIIDEKEQLLESASNVATSLHATGQSHYALTYLTKVKAMTLPVLLKGIERYLLGAPYKLAILTPESAKHYGAALADLAPHKQGLRLKNGKNNKRTNPPVKTILSNLPKPQYAPKLHSAASSDLGLKTLKTSPPHSTRVVQPSQPRKTTLTNGVTFIIEPKVILPKVSLIIRFKGGQAFEGEHAITEADLLTRQFLQNLVRKHQLSHIPYGAFVLLSKLLLAGNARYSKRALHELLKIHAIDCESHSGTGSVSLGFSYLKEKHDVVKRVLESIVLCAEFKKKDFAKEQQNTRFQIQRETESASRLSLLGFNKIFYQNTPYAYSLRGTDETLKQISLPLLTALREAFFTGAHTAVSLKGDFTASEADELAQLLGRLPAAPSTKAKRLELTYPKYQLIPIRKLPATDRFIKQQEPTAQETHVKLGFRTPALKSGKALVVRLIKSYLSGMGGPLFRLRSIDFIKEGKSLGGRAYSLGCSSQAEKDFGVILFNAALRKEAHDEYAFMRKAFLAEVMKLQKRPLSQRSLQSAKDAIRAGFMMNASSSFYHASLETLYQLYGMHFLAWKRQLTHLEKITADELQEVAHQLFHPDSFLEYVLQGSQG